MRNRQAPRERDEGSGSKRGPPFISGELAPIPSMRLHPLGATAQTRFTRATRASPPADSACASPAPGQAGGGGLALALRTAVFSAAAGTSSPRTPPPWSRGGEGGCWCELLSSTERGRVKAGSPLHPGGSRGFPAARPSSVTDSSLPTGWPCHPECCPHESPDISAWHTGPQSRGCPSRCQPSLHGRKPTEHRLGALSGCGVMEST